MPARNMRRSLAVLLLLAGPLLAEKFWVSREFTKWSERECMELLQKSPWAFSNAFGESPGPILSSDTTAPDTTSAAGEARRTTTSFDTDRKIIFEFRLRSAKPVRMAFGQLQLLRRPGDAAFQAQVAKFVEASPGGEIVIQASCRAVPAGSRAPLDVQSYFLHAGPADFLSDTSLASGKEKTVRLATYRSPNQQQANAEFVFPRLDEQGKPHFTGDEKSINFRTVLSPEIEGKKRRFDIFVKMNPKDMKYGGVFEF
jgi:hypothetical protein